MLCHVCLASMGNQFLAERPQQPEREGTSPFSFFWPHHLFTLKVFCLPKGMKVYEVWRNGGEGEL